jgi:hypothetical protein
MFFLGFHLKKHSYPSIIYLKARSCGRNCGSRDFQDSGAVGCVIHSRSVLGADHADAHDRR